MPFIYVNSTIATAGAIEPSFIAKVVRERIADDTTGLVGANLYIPDANDLIERRGVVHMVYCGRALLACCTSYRESDSSSSINSVVKVSGDAAVPRLVVAQAIVHEADTGAMSIHATVRVYPSGFQDRRGCFMTLNKPSLDIFTAFGFTVGTEEVRAIDGNDRDRHLIDSAEHDGRSFRVLVVTSSDRTAKLAREFLALHVGEKS